MERREFLHTTALLAGASLVRSSGAEAAETPKAAEWRIFELVTQVEIPAGGESTRVWLPLPAVHDASWIRPMGNLWRGNANDAYITADPDSGVQMLYAEWAGGTTASLGVVSRCTTRDRRLDLTKPGNPEPLSAADRARYTRATKLLPIDGVVRDTALRVTRGREGDLAQARALYQWVVESTARDPKTRGCGLGDIRFMLESGDLSGKCADLNALYVGLARSLGLPARDLYGVRVAASRLGFKSLGKSGDCSKAQHCRAEVYLTDFGWVPVDPADVRKVALEEPPGGLSLDAKPVARARQLLFGGWEGNWLPYNAAHDVRLPGSRGAELPFLMYPPADVDGKRRDAHDPASFRYRLTAREVEARCAA
jgi:transglutaminase-like putative cysteine protease